MSAKVFLPVPCCNDGPNQGLDTTHVTHRDFVLLVVARQIAVGEKESYDVGKVEGESFVF